MAASPVLSPQHVEHFEGGVSITVGTRNAKLVPEPARAVGVVVHPDRRTLTVFVPTDVALRTIANLRENSPIAVTFSSILDHHTTQVKGVLKELRDATESEREITTRYVIAFAEVMHVIGMPRPKTRALTAWPATAITFEIAEMYDQTPGPKAGTALVSR